MTFIRALSVFLGTVIGVGIFGLPFVALKAGFFVAVVYFVFMALIVVSFHIIYGEIVLGTEGIHRLPGYVERYLGRKWKNVVFAIAGVGLAGSLLAYLIVGGEFLNSLLSSYLGGNSIFYTLLFFSLGSYLIFRGIRSVSWIELSLLVVFFIILIVFFARSLPFINAEYLAVIDLKFLTFPYGVILFSLWGAAVVPEIKEMLVKTKNLGKKVNVRSSLRRVIIWGAVLSAFVYLFFIFIVLGVSGFLTSEEAISGLASTLGGNVIKLGFAFGIISCFTSFIALGLTLKKIFWYDFGFSKNFAWFVTCFLPLILFLLGMRKFIEIIGFVGAVSIGIEGIIIVYLYREFLRQKLFVKMNPVLYLLVGVFALGIIFEAFYFLFVRA